MSEHKKKRRTPINPDKIPEWLKNKAIKITNFAMVTDSFMKSKAVHELSHGTFRVYVAMAIYCRGAETFTFPIDSYTEYGLAKSTVIYAVKELIKKGFITKQKHYNGKPSVYTFTYSWKEK